MEVAFKNFTTQRISNQHMNESVTYYPKEWSRETILRLIELFREKRVLWDTNDIDFKNRNKKHYAWMDLGTEMGIDAMEVEKKMRMLIGQFRRELKRGKCGDNSDSPFKSKWAFFNYLMFLKIKNEASNSMQMSYSHNSSQDGTGETSNSIHENENRSPSDLHGNIRPSQGRRYYQKYINRNIGRRSRMELFKRKVDVTPTAPGIGAGPAPKKISDQIERRDEFDVFGEHVANTLRNLHSKLIQSHTKFEISNVLYRAEIDDHKQQVYHSIDSAIISGTATSYSFDSTPIPSNISTSTDNNDRNDEITTM